MAARYDTPPTANARTGTVTLPRRRCGASRGSACQVSPSLAATSSHPQPPAHQLASRARNVRRGCRPLSRRAQPPGRAPPFPFYAALQPAQGAGHRARAFAPLIDRLRRDATGGLVGHRAAPSARARRAVAPFGIDIRLNRRATACRPTSPTLLK